MICDRQDLVDSICKIDLSELEASSTIEPRYRVLLAKAIRSIWLEKQGADELILEAMEETDPDLPSVNAPDWALHIDVPLIKLIHDVYSKDVDFKKNFEWASELNEKFWSTGSRTDDWDGFISVELTGVLQWARMQDMTIKPLAVSRILVESN